MREDGDGLGCAAVSHEHSWLSESHDSVQEPAVPVGVYGGYQNGAELLLRRRVELRDLALPKDEGHALSVDVVVVERARGQDQATGRSDELRELLSVVLVEGTTERPNETEDEESL